MLAILVMFGLTAGCTSDQSAQDTTTDTSHDIPESWDACSNLKGAQKEVPPGYTRSITASYKGRETTKVDGKCFTAAQAKKKSVQLLQHLKRQALYINKVQTTVDQIVTSSTAPKGDKILNLVQYGCTFAWTYRSEHGDFESRTSPSIESAWFTAAYLELTLPNTQARPFVQLMQDYCPSKVLPPSNTAGG
jgi:hypothetical protein